MLRRLNGTEGIRRIRFMTSHPKDLSDGLIEAMATLDKVCPHIHLPLQSGSDAILQAMNRRYTRDRYAETVARLRAAVRDVELTTDIIVGFPGETEKDFLDTMDMMRRIGFAAAYTFQYSPRAGTKAATMQNQVPQAVKRERLHRLNALQMEMTERNNRGYIGRNGEVLVEGAGMRDGAPVAFGKLPNFKMVYFPGNASLIGSYLPVRIRSVKSNSLFGEREEEST